MSQHSIAEAEKRLSDLIDRALAGEGVVITREGRPIAELRPIRETARPVSKADLAWLRERRPAGAPAATDAGKLVSDLRDEDPGR